MERVFIVAAKRTPIGSFCGSFSNISAGELAGIAIKGAIESAQLDSQLVDEVIVGNVVSADQGMGVGRQAALYAGIPETVPAYSVNMVCGSGMKSLTDAASRIKAGEASIVIAAGVEVMSAIPFAIAGKNRLGQKMGDINAKDLLVSDGLTDAFHNYHMGMTAENVAKRFNITRQAQDLFAFESQKKAVAAIEQGRFENEIVPVDVQERRNIRRVSDDEYPKASTTLDGLAKLRPAFDKEGTVTAGNASGINDGASALVVVSETALRQLNLEPMCELVSSAQTGLAPEIMGLGPVESVTQALEKIRLSIQDIDLFELNEAFAAQALGVMQGLADKNSVSLDSIKEKSNLNGGAIALGHPLGASGNRIVVTLIHEMQKQKCKYGVASLCVGGGMGTAIVLRGINKT
jgi:acetyl-CoA C-acetyltransferase